MNKNTRDLIYRLQDASLASCTCGANTPVIQYHRELCHYRLMEEAREEIVRLSQPRTHYSPSGVYHND